VTYKATASIVTYHNPREMVAKAMRSFLAVKGPVRLYLVDNSSDRALEPLSDDDRVEYIRPGKNIGFGAGHNVAMRGAINRSPVHFILNPDVCCPGETVEGLVRYLHANPDVGLVMPRIVYPDGSIQRLCKLLPSPADLLGRRFLGWTEWVRERRKRYELHDADYDAVMNVPVLSGCFLAVRSAALARVGFFDERFFMYLEDVDLCRRIGQRYATVYYPRVTAVHEYGNGSYRDWRLLAYHMRSAFTYFTKWGWIWDPERDRVNSGALSRLGGGEGARISPPAVESGNRGA
jgi:hypothetical protein